MRQTSSAKVIDLTPYLRRARRRELARLLLGIWTQYLSLGALILYGLLRALACPGVPPGAYSGPLVLLWPASFLLLLASCAADRRL